MRVKITASKIKISFFESVQGLIPIRWHKGSIAGMFISLIILFYIKRSSASSKSIDIQTLPEFNLPKSGDNDRCPPVIPESYIVRHKIEGQIYRFYYRLAYDLKLSLALHDDLRPLPKGTLILLYNIIKYNMNTLIDGIEKCGLFKIKYNENYHQIVDTPNGRREYAVFSAFSEK